jgi:TolB-like protein
MFTDIVGYTALTQRDEALSMKLLEEHRALVRPFFPKHGGREVKTIGDAFLVEFGSALEEVRCAYDIQQSLHDLNNNRPADKRVELRVGINLGDVIHSQGDVYGDAVNVASRIEPLAAPGGICISEEVHRQVRNKLEFPMMSLGRRELKNVGEAVEVFRVALPWERQQESTGPGLDKNRVAVLPFTNMSSNPEEGYFADGITEEIITCLSKVRELRVTSRTSVMHYKGQTKRIPEIGRELGVGTVLEGSVRKAGSRVRVTVQMIDAEGDQHLWAENYDRTLDDIFVVQSEIAEKVAGELKVKLLQAEKNTLEKRPTENMEAYGDFLRGRELYREGSEPSLRQALKLFERAVELDPSFARAHVGVAECHQYLATVGYEPPELMLPAVKRSLKRALELDPDLAEAHASLAVLYLNEDDLEGTEAEARRALELNPSLPEAYRQLHEVAAIKGDPEEMVRDMETAYRLDPLLPNYIFLLGYSYFNTGREQEALEHWRRTEQLAPSATYQGMTDYYLSKGEVEKARELHAKYEKLRPNSPRVTYMGGFIDATAGEKEKALQAIQKIEERNMGPVAYDHVAYVYCALGDLDKYFENLNRAVDEHVLFATFVMYSPLLAKAREDPRYGELVEKIRRMNGLVK